MGFISNIFGNKKKKSFTILSSNGRNGYTSYPIVPKQPPRPPVVPPRTYLNHTKTYTVSDNIPYRSPGTDTVPDNNWAVFDNSHNNSDQLPSQSINFQDQPPTSNNLYKTPQTWGEENEVPVSNENCKRIDDWDRAIQSRIEMITKHKRRF